MIIKKNENLSKYTTIKIGGIAETLYIPETIEELSDIVRKTNNYLIISGGSNILINDSKTFPNVISMEKVNSSIDIDGDYVYCGASIRIQELIRKINSKNLGGIEYLFSLPALVGGCICMNAGRGSDKKSISDYLIYVDYIDEHGEKNQILKKDCKFGYRNSIFKNSKYIIVGAKFKFDHVEESEAKKEINERIKHCREYQDASYPNFGSIFMHSSSKIMSFIKFLSRFFSKNSGINYSKKTSNWLINKGNGKYSEAIKLINRTKRIHRLFHKKIKEEVIIWD